ncbi:gamma-glutamyl-gamma-aminobutyrate hydrolase family protein [Saxibacter everestensis]|uniref:Gamma-glutamyl-gamma-aminobutyrate hydrolase family protein n=1 Tax=Saxibacter everestensis TaxID=2909229 RepID=A0ABY8QQ60_9MICO|nr:gamma-glutamyl-gamma-aminobutyrate hydrolase family protein [Brevibacteriaceae bacterium ZFBP1038]
METTPNTESGKRRRPRIGLTTYLQQARWGVWDDDAVVLPATYVRGVAAAGGVPILLPPVGTDTSVLDVLDGLIIVGGVDVDPANYGEEPHPTSYFQPFRDDHDIALTVSALNRRLPLFAICRGAQVLNVALGGTLIQHLPDVAPEASNYQPALGQFGEVEIFAEPHSIAGDLLGESATAPCYHHQAIDRLADGLRVTASADNGIIEAVETIGAGWVLGVQWHPEQNPQDDRLFRGFIAAVQEQMEKAEVSKP